MRRVAFLLLLLLACKPKQEPPPPRPTQPPAVERKSEFLRYAERVRDSENQYYGRKQFPRLEKDLQSPDPAVRRMGHAFLGREYLRFSEVEKALDHLQKALDLVESRKDRAFVLELLGIAHLKQAEIDNCVALHGPESCILPFAPSALHRNPRGAERAIARLLESLEIEPRNARARWLLTFAHLILGKEPPERYAVPLPKAEITMRYPNIAPLVGMDLVNRAGGAVMGDFDDDGFQDLVTTDCEPFSPMSVWRNKGDGTFERHVLAEQLGGLNLSHADYDGDGRLDLLVLRGGWMNEEGRIRVSLLRNLGDLKFEDVTVQAGLAQIDYPTQTAAWADFDNDGDLDVFIGHERFPCRLLRNDRGRFTDVAAEAGVENERYCKGAVWGDYDNDGDPDLFVSNFGDPNRLYRNDRGVFTDVAPELGVTEPDFSFPCWFFDIDNDGWLDLFVAGYTRETEDVAADLLGWESKGARPRLYRNIGGKFKDVTREWGLWHVWQPMGANFGDLDEDGLLDIYLGTGFPTLDSIVPNVMLRNAGDRFQIVDGFGHVQKGHGVAWGDLDNDGDQDVFIEIGGFYPGDGFRNALFHNPGRGRNWIVIRPVGAINKFAFGARIAVTTPTRTIHRVVGTGGSFGGNSPQEEIGLGDETVESVEIVWPGSNRKQLFNKVVLNSFLELREGDPEIRVLQPKRVRFP